MNLVRVVVDAFPTIRSRINGHASMRPPVLLLLFVAAMHICMAVFVDGATTCAPPSSSPGGTAARRVRYWLEAPQIAPDNTSCTVEFMANLTKYQDAIDRFCPLSYRPPPPICSTRS